MRLELLTRRASSASRWESLLRKAWRVGLGLVVLALITVRGATQPTVTIAPRPLAVGGGPTLVPCGPLPAGTTTWNFAGSPYILPVNTTNDPVANDPAACPAFPLPGDPQPPNPPGVVVGPGQTLIIDASQGPVQIFSHGAGITVDGGTLQTKGTSFSTQIVNSKVRRIPVNYVAFDAEPDVASWDGISIISSDGAHRGNASLALTSIAHALTSISINSGATSTIDPAGSSANVPFGLALLDDAIGPSYFDGIDATNTPISFKGEADQDGLADGQLGTVNNIGSQGIKLTFDTAPPVITGTAVQVKFVTFGSSVPFGDLTCLPLTQCAAGTIGNDAIQETPNDKPQPSVDLENDRFFRAGSYGVELNNANNPTITNNRFDCNGSGTPKPLIVPCTGTGLKYSAIYLNNATADLENKVTGNQGHEDGLDAVVFNGKVTSPTFTWRNATNDLNNDHALGYLLNGSLDMVGGVFRVPGGSVVKGRGGAINLNGTTLDASAPNSAGAKVFTSLRDPVNIASCPSVFAQDCGPSPLPAGEWGGINLIGAGANATINDANILYATTAIQITNGAVSSPAATSPLNAIGTPAADGANYGLVVTNTTIGPTFADGIASLDTPISVSGGTIACPAPACGVGQQIGNHGIAADFTGIGPVGSGLKVSGVTFNGTVNEAILGLGLSGQTVQGQAVGPQTVSITQNTITHAGTFGINLQGAVQPRVRDNSVSSSGTGATKYAAIYLNGLTNGDFTPPPVVLPPLPPPNPMDISGNNGTQNGLDAIVFHGTTLNNTPLNWQTVDASNLLGYIVDGNLTVNGDMNLNSGSDYAPVLFGTITVKGALTTNGATFTSLKDNSRLATCPSFLVPKLSGVCPSSAPGDWGGLALDSGHANRLSSSEIQFANNGITLGAEGPGLNGEALTLTNTTVRNVATDGIVSQSPISVTGGGVVNAAASSGRGIAINLDQEGPATGQSVLLKGTANQSLRVSGTGQEGVSIVSFGLQPIDVEGITVDHSGASGIKVAAASSPIVKANQVSSGARGFAAIYMPDVKHADFSGMITGNKGGMNGVDALIFHGSVDNDLSWLTARNTDNPNNLLGYALDGNLDMTGTLTVKAGGIVKANGGSINLTGGTLDAGGTLDEAGHTTASPKTFTSLKDATVGIPCPSGILANCSVAAGDWGGISLAASPSHTGGSGTLLNGAIRDASTGILINSEAAGSATSSTYGLVVSRSSISSSLNDAIVTTKTAISVSDSSITGGVHGIKADLTTSTLNSPPPAPSLRLSGNRFQSTSAEAILGQALAGRPVFISDNHVRDAGTFGIRLLNADHLVLRNNNISTDTVITESDTHYPAIYLSAVKADFSTNVRGNVGSNNGLDAIVMDGKATGNLPWITPVNPTWVTGHATGTNPLGFLLDGGLTVDGGTMSVPSGAHGAVVESLGGPITINGGSLDASDSGPKVFTSMKDDHAPVVSCPSFFAPVCGPNKGDWGGLSITDSPAGKGSATIANALINYADTGVYIDSGPIAVGEKQADHITPLNFRLTVSDNTRIYNASKDGISALDTPISVDGTFVGDEQSTLAAADRTVNINGHGIIASFFSPANCPSPAGCSRLSITGTDVAWTGKDGIIANGLGGQPVSVHGNTINHAGTYGMRLVGADTLQLTDNEVSNSGAPGSAIQYPAVYLNGVSGDFESANGISRNTGLGNGMDAVVFHGTASNGLTWLTPGATSIPTSKTHPLLGFMLDNALTVNGKLTTSGVVKVLAGGIKVNGSLDNSAGAIFTNMQDPVDPSSCATVFLPLPGSASQSPCPQVSDYATVQYWGGINLDADPSSFIGGGIRYASSGITISGGPLTMTDATVQNISGDAITLKGVDGTFTRDAFAAIAGTAIKNTSGSGPGTGALTITCSSIQGNGTGVIAGGTATIKQSDLYNNGQDLTAAHGSDIESDYLGNNVTADAGVVDPAKQLKSRRPSLDTADGGSALLDDTNKNFADNDFGTGTLTATLSFNRQMNLDPNLNTPDANPVVSFSAPGGAAHSIAGDWLFNSNPAQDPNRQTWIGTDALTQTGTSGQPTADSGVVSTLSVSKARSCVPPEPGNPNSNLMKPPSAPPTFQAELTELPAVPVPLDATNRGAGSATMNATVDALGWETTATFFWSDPSDTSKHGSVPATDPVGHANGVQQPVHAQVTGLQLPNHTYSYHVVATNGNGTTVASPEKQFTTTGPAAKLRITDPPSANTAGTAIDETIDVIDANTTPNVVADYAGSITVTSSDPQATWSLKNDPTTAGTFPHTFVYTAADLGTRTLSVIFGTAGSQTLTASATGLTSGTQMETIIPGAATSLTMTAPATATAGSGFNVTVTATDAYGNQASGYTGTVAFGGGGSGASLPANYTFTSGTNGTEDNGSHQFSGVILRTAGNQTITVTDQADSSLTDSVGVSVAPNAAATLTLTAPSTATAGGSFAMTVKATDAYGNQASGYTGTVAFSGGGSGATLPANYTFTSGTGGDNGSHQFSGVMLKTAGNQTVTVTDQADNTLTGSAVVSVSADVAKSLVLTAPAAATAGTGFSVTVTATDAYGNAASTYTGTVAFTGGGNGATLPANYTFTSGTGTEDNGTHQFTGVILKTAGNQTITVTDSGTSSLTKATDSAVVNLSAAAAKSLALTAPATTTAGTAFSVTVTATDAYSNTASSYTGTVAFTGGGNGASLPSSYTFTSGGSGDNGSHQFSGVILKTAGNQTITVTDSGTSSLTKNSDSAVVSVSADVAKSLALTAPATATAGSGFSLTVSAKDAYGNRATGYTGTVAFSGGGNGATLPADYTFTSGTGGDNGSHQFSGVILEAAGNQTITVTDTGTNSLSKNSDSALVSVSADVAKSLALTAPATATAGTGFSLTVSAKDAYGNQASGYTGTVAFSGGGNGATLPADYTFTSGTGGDNGSHTFTSEATLIQAGNQTVTVKDKADGTLTDSEAVSVAPASVTALELSAPTGTTAGDSFSVTVRATDAYGNTATGYVGSVSFSGGGNGATLPANYTFTSGTGDDNGRHQFSGVILKIAGNQSITVTDQADGTLTDTATVNVTPAALAGLNLAAPSSSTAGDGFSITVTAEDAYGNKVPSYTGSVAFSGGGNGASLPADYTFTSGASGTEDNGSHQFSSVVLKTAGSQTITVTDQADSSLTGSAVVSVSANVAKSLVLTAPPTVTAGSSFSVTVTAKDAYGNIANGYTGTVTFSGGGAGATLPADYTFTSGNGGTEDNGSHVFTGGVTLTATGSQTVTVMDTLDNSLTDSATVVVST